MTHTDLEQLIESANPQRPLDQDHHDALLARIDTIASGETTGQAALLRQKTRSPMVKVTAVAASIGLLAGTALAINTMLSPTPSWAKGVELDPQDAQQALETCRTKTVSDVYELNTGQTMVEPAETEGSVIRMAENRGQEIALWFETPAGVLGTCLLTRNDDGTFSEPWSALWSHLNDESLTSPGSREVVATYVLNQGEGTSAIADLIVFGQTDTSIVRSETEFINGATSTGIVRNGLYFLMNRVEYPNFKDNDSVSTGDAKAIRTTFYRADGSGFSITYPDHPQYTGSNDIEQVREFD